MKKDIEQEVYEKLCSYCPFSRRCHEEVLTCTEFDIELAKAQNKNKGGK